MTLPVNKFQKKVVKLLDAQYEFIMSQKKEVLFSGGFGSGKSIALCYKIAQHASIPFNSVLLCRKTRSSLVATTLRTLLTGEGIESPPVLQPGSYEINGATSTIKLNGGGTIFYTGIADEEKIKSFNAGAVAVDEATELTEEEWTILLSRCRNKVDPVRQIFAATNPGSKSHFLYKKFFVDKNPDRQVITTSTIDNFFLPQDYIKNLLSSLNESQIQRFVKGLWVMLTGSVYDNFDRDKHTGTYTNDPTKEDYFICLDTGFAADPTVATICGVDVQGIVRAYNEVVLYNMLTKELIDKLEPYKGYNPLIIIDPSSTGVKLELENAGFRIIGANNTIDVGIKRVRDYISKEKLFIDKECVNMISEFEIYAYKNSRPVDKFNHSLDGIRYLINYLEDQRFSTIHPTATFININSQEEDDDQ